MSLKLDTLIGRKNSVVKQNNDGILYLFKKNKVTFFHGKGAFAGQVEGGWAIKVTGTTEEDLVASTWSWRPVRRRASCPACRSTRRSCCPTTAR